MWMPRPFPGGRSTCVGGTSPSGELKVPTYATSGRVLAGWARSNAVANGATPAVTSEDRRKWRREYCAEFIGQRPDEAGDWAAGWQPVRDETTRITRRGDRRQAAAGPKREL